jgi:hypothetical protein
MDHFQTRNILYKRHNCNMFLRTILNFQQYFHLADSRKIEH